MLLRSANRISQLNIDDRFASLGRLRHVFHKSNFDLEVLITLFMLLRPGFRLQQITFALLQHIKIIIDNDKGTA